MACTPADLSEAAKCFMCLSEKQLLAIIAYGSCEFGGGGVKRYVALVSQVDTDAPTAIVLENSISDGLVWNYVGVGHYTLTCSGCFTVNKSTVNFTNAVIAGGNAYFPDANTLDVSGLSDGLMDGANWLLEIEVYP